MKIMLELVPDAGPWPPLTARLKRLLKAAKRAYGMTCVAARLIDEPNDPPPQPQPPTLLDNAKSQRPQSCSGGAG